MLFVAEFRDEIRAAISDVVKLLLDVDGYKVSETIVPLSAFAEHGLCR